MPTLYTVTTIDQGRVTVHSIDAAIQLLRDERDAGDYGATLYYSKRAGSDQEVR